MHRNSIPIIFRPTFLQIVLEMLYISLHLRNVLENRQLVFKMNYIFNLQLFDKIRRERPADLQKIVPIIGDVTEPELGIGPADQALLCRQVFEYCIFKYFCINICNN